MSNFEHKCQMCDGDGEDMCGACGHACECEHCEGEGIDPNIVDLAAFEAAEKVMFAGCKLGTGALIENNVWVGRVSCDDRDKKLYYRDFLKEKK